MASCLTTTCDDILSLGWTWVVTVVQKRTDFVDEIIDGFQSLQWGRADELARQSW